MNVQENIVGRAIAIAAEVHQNQVDKGDEPYILHCLEVGRRSGERFDALGGFTLNKEFYRDCAVAAGVLHDGVEDFEGGPIESGHLRDRIALEFPSVVHEAIIRLTKGKGLGQYEAYDEYIERVARHWLARLVKLCDLSHNLEAWRIPSGKITEKDYARWDKYHRAFVRLHRED